MGAESNVVAAPLWRALYRSPPLHVWSLLQYLARASRVLDFCPWTFSRRMKVQKVLPIDSGGSALFSWLDLQGTISTFVPAHPIGGTTSPTSREPRAPQWPGRHGCGSLCENVSPDNTEK